MEKPRLTGWVGPFVGWDGVSEDFQGRANSVSQVYGVSDMVLACQLCGTMGEGLEEGQWPLLPLCLKESCPTAPALMPDTSVFPHMPLVPFMLLLPWCWRSEGMSLRKSMSGFFKRNCSRLQKFLPLTQSPLVFATRSYRDFFSWHYNPGVQDVV